MKMPKIITKNLNLWYGKFHALKDVNACFEDKRITAIIGPSGCGKSTLLRVFNRMNDLIEGVKMKGEVLISGANMLAKEADLVNLRKKVGMVFQRPNPFPLSIYENIVFGEKIHAEKIKKSRLEEIVEKSLDSVLLWNELKDRLNKSALSLSLEQRQRLCIARLIAVKPDILLMDEPCSALDPQSTQRIEELMRELKKNYTIIIVTHNMQQAARVSDDAGFMLLGELIEFGRTDGIFTTPQDKRTEDYITGRYG
ncbi:MAG: phosphate ABC transporter ATP-binding protein [Candidatus Omnitrophica bacterium CG11_big_fil_rev_8_21_14_0_20_42_13]|uniref:Phosphate ABC transporter ATP-binding protein n=1 Tax=Candidatus Ghiorseimicrobium undicola TaxID=1974746 RepID=A0A2H0LW63_9BACT|nr:MAG: phosphate ABC transporter ATP-binding protein [Candidatus Omnitrophica bacterium CG11_big_fil_rev_8_21_14_0_20_42_13]